MQEFDLFLNYFLFYIVDYNISSSEEEFPFPTRKETFKITIIKKQFFKVICKFLKKFDDPILLLKIQIFILH